MKSPPRHLLATLVLVTTTILASWYAMMITHESGHVLAAWISGGRVVRVVLHPLAFSRTDLASNPHPMLVAWGGPAWGSALPLAVWLVARAMKFRLAFLLRFFSGFCLVANGAYLVSAAAIPAGDTHDMLRLGAPLWSIVTPGVVATASGLMLWNGLGPSFGTRGQHVDRMAIIAMAASLFVLLTGVLVWSSLMPSSADF